MRFIKHLSKVILLLLFLALAFYAFYYYQVKRSVDRQIQEISPFVQAQYDSLYVNPLGEIHLNTVTLDLMGQAGVVIDRIRLQTDPLFLLQFDSRVAQGDWPDSLTFAVEGMNVDFNMPLFTMMEQLAVNQSEGVQLNALGCGRVTQFDLASLRMMGMRHGRFDFFLNVRNHAPEHLNLQLLSHMHGWGELSLDVDLSGQLAIDRLSTAMTTSMPSLQRVSVSLRDTGYNQRKNQFCSMQSGLSVAEYREQHQIMVMDWVEESAIAVPQHLVDAYHQLGEPGSHVSVQLDLAGINPQEMLSPEQFLELLGQSLHVSVNNQQLMLDSESASQMLTLLQQPVMVMPSEEFELIEQDPNLPRSMPGVASPPVQVAPNQMPRRYQRTPAEELVNYVGHPVRFYTSFGKRVDGILMSIEGNTVRVAERVQHGVAQYPVEIETIQSPEVYR